MNKRAGFTLIEVLIVLVIVAVITAVAVLAFGHFGQGRREKIILEQFSATINAVQQQAIFTPMALGLGITEKGYQYYQYTPDEKEGGKWTPIASIALTHPTIFAHVFEVHVDQVAAFDSNAEAAPSILFLPSGFVTPFQVRFVGKRNNYVMTVKNNGAVFLETHEKK